MGGYSLTQQWDELSFVLATQLERVRALTASMLWRSGSPAAGDIQTITQLLLPDPARLLGSARTALSATLGIAGSALMVVLIAIFAAADPAVYRRGILRLTSASLRPRMQRTLDETADVLRWWLLGQLVTMVLLGVSIGCALALVGVPGALLLAVQAALLNFIPYIGPFLGAIPIGLAAAAQGMSALLWTFGLYILIQTGESYVLMPLVQKKAVHIQPVLTLAGLIVFGALFGPLGLALATPLVAVARVTVEEFWLKTNPDC